MTEVEVNILDPSSKDKLEAMSREEVMNISLDSSARNKRHITMSSAEENLSDSQDAEITSGTNNHSKNRSSKKSKREEGNSMQSLNKGKISSNSIKSKVADKVSDPGSSNEESTVFYDRFNKGSYSVFARKMGDRATAKSIPVVETSGLLSKANVKFQTVVHHSWNTWMVYFSMFQEANNAVRNQLTKKMGLSLYVPRYRVQRKGVIRGIPLDITLEELNKAIKYENPSISIDNLFRLKRKDRVTKKWIDSSSVCVTFKGYQGLLGHGRLAFQVTVYVPPLRRCFRCGRFGHTSKGCSKKKDIYLNYGNVHVLSKENPCSVKSRCINCQEAHHTLSSECQTYKLNLSINKAMALDNISYVEARRVAFNLQKAPASREVSLQKDLRNFPRLPGTGMMRECSGRLGPSFVEVLRKHSQPMEDSGILEDFLAKLSAAPDKGTLWMRLIKTVDLHTKNCGSKDKPYNSVISALND